MRVQLTITMEESVYLALRDTAGSRRIGQFIEDAVRPLVRRQKPEDSANYAFDRFENLFGNQKVPDVSIDEMNQAIAQGYASSELKNGSNC